jgi:RNA recognition motif-containing protein
MLTEDESKRLFFSVGRSRRVYPREILGLINAKTAVAREDIGAIRILDNYSFVQVRDSVAEKIIEALNGVNFRGRTLAVNYAKFRKEEENGAGENESGPDSEAGTAEADESEPNAELD